MKWTSVGVFATIGTAANAAFLELTDRLARPGRIEVMEGVLDSFPTAFEFAACASKNGEKGIVLFCSRRYPIDPLARYALVQPLDVVLFGLATDPPRSKQDREFASSCVAELHAFESKAVVKSFEWIYDADDESNNRGFLDRCRAWIDEILGPEWRVLPDHPVDCPLLAAERIVSRTKVAVQGFGIGWNPIPGLPFPAEPPTLDGPFGAFLEWPRRDQAKRTAGAPRGLRDGPRERVSWTRVCILSMGFPSANAAFLHLTNKLERPGFLGFDDTGGETDHVEFAPLIDATNTRGVLLFVLRRYPMYPRVLQLALRAVDVCVIGFDPSSQPVEAERDFRAHCLEQVSLFRPDAELRPFVWARASGPGEFRPFLRHCRGVIDGLLGPGWTVLETQPPACPILEAAALRATYGEALAGALGVGWKAIEGLPAPPRAAAIQRELDGCLGYEY